MFLISFQVWGEKTDVSFSLLNGKTLVCTISTEPFRTRNIINSMELGHRSEINYSKRVYEDKSRFIGLFGDRLIDEVTTTYVATRDPFEDIFHITDSSGKKKKIKGKDSFFTTFFSVDDMTVDMNKAGRGEYYVTGKVEIKIIKLMPPLNLLSRIIPGVIEKSGWISAGSFRIK
ncbi:MAG: hypothetical protein RBT69_00810 [Spirochaetia bacterium]|jgi:hypothetical protein|nr:hypothetical protein [Spirochaetia bacterium]